MKKRLLHSSLLSAIVLALSVGCVEIKAPTAQPRFEFNRGANLVKYGNPARGVPSTLSALTPRHGLPLRLLLWQIPIRTREL
jgi:hypothetical protein